MAILLSYMCVCGWLSSSHICLYYTHTNTVRVDFFLVMVDFFQYHDDNDMREMVGWRPFHPFDLYVKEREQSTTPFRL